MVRRFTILLCLFVLGGLLFVYTTRSRKDGAPQDAPPSVKDPGPVQFSKPDALPPASTTPAGLEGYAAEASTARDDLQLLHGFISAKFLIVKNHDPRHYATNEDLTLFLRGENPHKEVFLPGDHSLPHLINKNDQLIDRWGSPLIVHPISHQVLELRSAGPDRAPYTEDDVSWPPAAR